MDGRLVDIQSGVLVHRRDQEWTRDVPASKHCRKGMRVPDVHKLFWTCPLRATSTFLENVQTSCVLLKSLGISQCTEVHINVQCVPSSLDKVSHVRMTLSRKGTHLCRITFGTEETKGSTQLGCNITPWTPDSSCPLGWGHPGSSEGQDCKVSLTSPSRPGWKPRWTPDRSPL